MNYLFCAKDGCSSCRKVVTTDKICIKMKSIHVSSESNKLYLELFFREQTTKPFLPSGRVREATIKKTKTDYKK